MILKTKFEAITSSSLLTAKQCAIKKCTVVIVMRMEIKETKKSTSTHTELAVIFAGSLFIKDGRVAHSFHDTLVPGDGSLQHVQAHGQLGGRLGPSEGVPPDGEALGDLVRIGHGLHGRRSSGGLLRYRRQVRIAGASRRNSG